MKLLDGWRYPDIGRLEALDAPDAIVPLRCDTHRRQCASCCQTLTAGGLSGTVVGMILLPVRFCASPPMRYPPSTLTVPAAFVATLMLAGCAESSVPSLTTGSLFGATQTPVAAPKKPELRNDPLARTLQVSRVAARAQRCGYNFDPARLKTSFMSYEGAQGGADAATLAKLDQNYTVTYNATLKVISGDEGYCSEARNAHIKGDLTRHLAGDFAPSLSFAQAESDGIFSFGGGLFGGEKPAE